MIVCTTGWDRNTRRTPVMFYMSEDMILMVTGALYI